MKNKLGTQSNFTTSLLFKKLTIILVSFFAIHPSLLAQLTPYEIHGKNYTATYFEAIDYYQQLDNAHRCVSMHTMGMTDAGLPLHVVLISKKGRNQPEQWKQDQKVVILINNGIHPGEPDGIDACMMMARDLAKEIEEADSFPDNIALAIIPVYNIGGCLHRSENFRPDQNGPEAFGARGNSKNFDLNRDFIKCDSKEAMSFAEIFHWIQPDVFIDNHVSDGADYQHVMTLATTQHNKLGGVMSEFLVHQFEPSLYRMMKAKSYDLIPYVNVWGKDAKDGWNEFFDGPRYSSGYAALFNTFAFTFETHMLKPYPQRVEATYQLMRTVIDCASQHCETIKSVRNLQLQQQYHQQIFPLSWNHDDKAFKQIELKGYEYKTMNSKVSNLPVKYYDHNEPYTQQIPFFNTYTAANKVIAPEAYIVPQAYSKIIALLKSNQVDMQQFDEDQTVNVEAYKISSYKSGNVPYEGHHYNSNVELEKINLQASVRKGDYLISLHQPAKRFIIEVLEPEGSDSYFSWNYFDAILVQKEGYSDYSFEPIAAEYLQTHPEVRNLLTSKCQTDTAFAKSASAQLDFVYRQTPYVEPHHNLYPIYRLLEGNTLDRLIEVNANDGGYFNKEDE